MRARTRAAAVLMKEWIPEVSIGEKCGLIGGGVSERLEFPEPGFLSQG